MLIFVPYHTIHYILYYVTFRIYIIWVKITLTSVFHLEYCTHIKRWKTKWMTALISLANLLKAVVHSTLWTTPKYSPHTISFFSFGCLINFILIKINQNIYIYMEVLGYGYCNESYSSTALISFNPLLQ